MLTKPKNCNAAEPRLNVLLGKILAFPPLLHMQTRRTPVSRNSKCTAYASKLSTMKETETLLDLFMPQTSLQGLNDILGDQPDPNALGMNGRQDFALETGFHLLEL